MFTALLIFIGGYTLACYLYEHLRTPLRLLVNTICEESRSVKFEYGEWAAITGSSDGIGKAYAKELASYGVNIVLIARNEEKLKAVAQEISNEYKVETKIVVADFTEGIAVYDRIEKELDKVPVAILVNNVGMSSETPGPLFKSSREHVQHIIDTNVGAVSHLCRYILKRWRENNIKGAIVNVSSGTDLQPVPYAALYAASKAYTRSLTQALQWEAHKDGILVQLLSPNFVVTKINSYSKRIMGGGLFIPSAEDYARSSVEQLRVRIDETPGFFWHHVQNALITLLPTRLRIYVVQTFFQVIVDKKHGNTFSPET
ncbi:hydroxysteroid dehydrogenase-like protein 1 [Scaptodrosophila lebanonensis]|uniref:Hydroxysteroid dehydrogenase-like protein 1 n=1 Tax=Drosophila lebanonensis TaxID=7225 RepID=A0A6J2U636_DROLE|nr:hydroxysteroid dehydrogenase-like protein 1 [Scaptodrosophila lebanonensis]